MDTTHGYYLNQVLPASLADSRLTLQLKPQVPASRQHESVRKPLVIHPWSPITPEAQLDLSFSLYIGYSAHACICTSKRTFYQQMMLFATVQ